LLLFLFLLPFIPKLMMVPRRQPATKAIRKPLAATGGVTKPHRSRPKTVATEVHLVGLFENTTKRIFLNFTRNNF